MIEYQSRKDKVISVMSRSKFAIGQHVKLRTSDDMWNNRFGAICEVENDIVTVYCVTMPGMRFFVNQEEAENVLDLV